MLAEMMWVALRITTARQTARRNVSADYSLVDAIAHKICHTRPGISVDKHGI